MDFVINTLLTNPYVKNKVEDAERTIGKKNKSILCMDLAPGVYDIEHDYYFRKHADAPRMEVIYEKWKKNKTSLSLSRSQLNVLTRELLNIRYKSKEKHPKFFEITEKLSYEAKDQISPEVLSYYFNIIYPERRTVAQASKMDHRFEWGEMQGDKFDAFLSTYKKMIDLSLYPLKVVTDRNVLYIAPKGTAAPPDWKKEFQGNNVIFIPPENFNAPADWKVVQSPICTSAIPAKCYKVPNNFKIPTHWKKNYRGVLGPPEGWTPTSEFNELINDSNWMLELDKAMQDLGYDPSEMYL
jgi:hypothetical protein